MPQFMFLDFQTGTTRMVLLPDGCEPCCVCDMSGVITDDYGDEMQCPECDGDGIIESAD